MMIKALAGCEFQPPSVTASVAEEPCAEWQPQHFEPCELPVSEDGLELLDPGTYVYNTDTRTLIDPAGNEVAHQSTAFSALVVLFAQRVKIGSEATLRAIGEKPLLVASWSDITVAGAITVSSEEADGKGAGADPVECESVAAESGESDPGGAGGGGGGGFGEVGGSGGDGDSNENAGDDGIGTGGIGGRPALVSIDMPFVPRGGCPGADGGVGAPSKLGLGGPGGGAIQLTALQSIAVNGMITAAGQGGSGDDQDAGGGGGGSGGYLGLDAPQVDVSGATLACNGGGGGGGGDDGNRGGLGENGSIGMARALGGSGSEPGGTAGARGGSAESPAGESVVAFDTGGGGGGGGSVGLIAVWTDTWLDAEAILSPTPTRFTERP